MKAGENIKFKLNIRETYNGNKILPKCLKVYLNNKNKVFDGRVMWLQDNDDPYPGEYAINSEEYFKLAEKAWISSGDIILIKK